MNTAQISPLLQQLVVTAIPVASMGLTIVLHLDAKIQLARQDARQDNRDLRQEIRTINTRIDGLYLLRPVAQESKP